MVFGEAASGVDSVIEDEMQTSTRGLLAKSGTYARLHALQFREEDEE